MTPISSNFKSIGNPYLTLSLQLLNSQKAWIPVASVRGQINLVYPMEDNILQISSLKLTSLLKAIFTKMVSSVASPHSKIYWSLRWCLRGINTLRSRQNGRRFTNETFKRIFLNENIIILIEISLKFVPKGPINNIPALVQIMAWRW